MRVANKTLLTVKHMLEALMVHDRLTVCSVERFSESASLSAEAVNTLIFRSKIPVNDKALSTHQSARFVRLLKIYRAVATLFEDSDSASEFMMSPCSAAGGITPIACASTNEKAQIIMQVIGRLEHGIPV